MASHKFKLLLSLLSLTSALNGSLAFASKAVPHLLPFQGRLTDSGGVPINYPVVVKFRIYPPTGTCYLYEDTQNITPSTYGIFSALLGAPGYSSGPANNFAQVFNNDTSGLIDSCSGTYVPAVNDWRRIEIVVDGQAAPDMQTIGAAPFSINTNFLEGKSASQFVQIQGNLTQANADALVGSGDASSLHHHDSIYAKIDGSNSYTGNVNTSGKVGVGTTSANADVDILKNNPSLRLGSVAGSGGTSKIDFYSGTSTQRASIQSSETTNVLQFFTGSTEALRLDSSQNAIFAGSIQVAGTISSGKYTDAQETTLVTALTSMGALATGTLWTNSTTSKIKYWDGSQVQVLANGASIINSISAGTGINISGTAINPVINATYGTTAGTAVEGNASFGGDVSGTYNNLSVIKLKGKGLDSGTANTMGQFYFYNSVADEWKLSQATAPTDGQILKWNDTTKTWAPATDAMGWTAVDATTLIKGIMRIGSGLTDGGSGLVNVDYTTTGQSNKVLALDGSGVANTQGVGFTNTGTVTLSAQTASSTYGLKLPASAPTANQSFKSDSSGNLSWVTYLSAVSDTALLANGKVWVGNASGVASEVALSGDATISNAGVVTLKNTGTAGTYGASDKALQIVTDAQGRITSVTEITINDTTKLPLAGGTMSGAIAMGGQNITNTGDISMAANKYFGLSANSTNGSVAGQMWYDSGTIKYYDGSTVKSLGVQGSGVTTLNGLSAVTQSFAVGTSGNAPAFSSVTDTHTLNIPMASASGSVTAGLLSNAEYAALNAKQSNALADGSVWIGNSSGGAQARALSGDATISNAGVVTVDKTQAAAASKILQLNASSVAVTKGLDVNGSASGTISLRGQAAAGTYTLTFPNSAGSANQFLQTDGAGNLSWASSLTSISDVANLTNGKLWVGNASGKAVEVSLSGDATMDSAGALTLASTITAGSNKGAANKVAQITYDAKGRLTAVTEITIDDNTKLPLAGGALTGDLSTQNITMAANKYFGLSANSTNGSVAGQMWYDSGTIKYYDGSAVKSLGVAGAGITSLNGLSSVSQSFAIGTSGNSPSFSSVTDTHTLNIPMASSAGTVTAGLLSNAEYVALNAKQSTSLAAAKIWVGNASGTAEAQSLGGDIASVSNTGSVTVDKTATGQSSKILALDGSGIANMYGAGIKGATSGVVTLQSATTTANYSLTFPAAQGAAGEVLSNNGSGVLSWISPLTSVSDTADLASAKIWVGNASGKAEDVTMSGDATLSSSGALTLASTITAGSNKGASNKVAQITYDAKGRLTAVTEITIDDNTKLPLVGGALTGDLSTQNITMAANKYFGLSANSTNGSVAGQMWYDSGTIKYYDGSSVKSLGVQGSGVTSLNGLSAVTQSFAIGTSGNSPSFNSVTDTHTLNIPMASASGSVTAGLLSNAEYAALNAKQSNALADGSVWIGNSSGGAQARALSGDATISNAGVVTVDKTQTAAASKILQLTASSVAVTKGEDIGGAGSGIVSLRYPSTATNTTLTFPNSAGSANQFLQTDGAGNLSWVSSLTSISDVANLTNGKLWIGNASGKAVEVSVSGDATMDNAGALTLASTITAGSNKGAANKVAQITYDAKGRLTAVTEVTIDDNTKLPLAGGTMSGAIAMGGQDITNAGNISMAANKYFSLSANGTNGSVAGQMWYDSGTIKYYDGSTVKSLGVAGAGITSLNGLSSVSQSFAIGTGGNAPAFNSATDTHTLNIPMASSAGTVTAGLISNTDYNRIGDAENINGKVVDSTAASTMGQILFFDSVADKWKVSASAAPTDGQVMKWNNTTKTWEPGNDTGGWTAVDASYAAKGIVQFQTDAATSGINVASGVANVVRTTTGTSSTILSLDGSGVANMYGVGIKGATSGTVVLQAPATVANYSLTFPAAAPASSQILKSDASGNLSWASGTATVSDAASLANGKMWVGNASGIASEVTMSGDATMDNAGALTLASTITAGSNKGAANKVAQITYDAKGRLTSVTEVTIDDNTKLPLAGGTMSGAIAMGGQNITNTGDISMAANKYFSLSVNGTNGTVAGQMWYDGGVIKYFDGSTVKSLGVAGAGITNLNGLSSVTQSFAIGTSGNAPAFSSVTDTHTLNIPMASASGSVTAGLLSNAEYVALNAKQSNALADGSVWIGNSSGGAQARALSGDATISNAGVVTVDKTQTAAASKILQLTASSVAVTKGADIGGAGSGIVSLRYPNTATNTTLTFPNSAGSANQFLQTDGAGNLSWVSSLTSISDVANLTNGKLWIGNASGKAVEVSVSGDATMDSAGALTLASTITAGSNKGAANKVAQITYDAKGRLTAVTEITIDDNTKLPLAGGALTGDLSTQNITMAANKYFGLSANSTNGSVAGQMWYDSGTIKYYDGSAVKSLGVAGAGITSLNGLSSVSQSFDIGTSGNAPAFNSATDTHTLNIPMASASGSVTAGLLSNAEYVALNAKQSTSLAAAKIWVGNASGAAEAQSLGGDIASVSNTGSVTIDKTTTGQSSKILALDGSGIANMYGAGIKGATSGTLTLQAPAAVTNYSLTFPAAQGAAGEVLSNNGSGVLSWISPLSGINNTADLTAAKMWVGNASGKAAEVSLSGDASLSNAGALTLASTITAAGPTGSSNTIPVITYDAKGRLTTVSTATVDDTTKLPLAGGTMSGAIAMGGQDITNAGNISMAANKYFSLSANGTNGSVAGQMWYDSGTIKYYDGSTVKSLGVAGAGITSLNGLSSVSQSFDIGTSGNAPAFNSATDTHTLNIPMASASGSVTAGLLSNAEYAALSAKQGNALVDGSVWIGNSSGGAQARALSGDATISNAGVVTVDKTQAAAASKILQLTASSVAVTKGEDIGGAGSGIVSLRYPNTATNTTLTFPNSAGSANQFLQTDGAGNLIWATPSASLPSLAAAKIWVGNASGGPEAQTLGGDISAVSNAGSVTVDKTTTGQSSKILALDGSGVANMYGVGVMGTTSGTVTLQSTATTANYSLTLPAAQGSSGQVLSNNGSGVLSWISPLIAVNNSADLASAKIWVGNASGKAVEVTMSGDATISNSGALTLANTGTAGTYYKVTTDAQGRVTSGSSLVSGDITTALSYTPVNKAGDTMTGTLNLASNGLTVGTTQLVVSGGNVGIGQTPTTDKLEVNGNIRATAFFYTSDRRLKKDFQEISGLETILRLHGVAFRWKETNAQEIGLIAQEVEAVLPTLVQTDKITGMKSVKYGNLVAPLIESTKELYGLCQDTRKRTQTLEAQQARTVASVHALEDKVRKLEEENKSLRQEVEEIKNLIKSRK